MAADCKNAWLHPGWEDTVRRWYKLLYEMKKDEEKRVDVEHQTLVSNMLKNADG